MRRAIVVTAMGSFALVVPVLRAGPNPSLVFDGDFSNPNIPLANGDYLEEPSPSPAPPAGSHAWTFTPTVPDINTNDAGIAAAGSTTFPHTVVAPDNGQIGWLQNVASMSQTITPTVSGKYTFSFDSAVSTDSSDNPPGQISASVINDTTQSPISLTFNNSSSTSDPTGLLSTTWKNFTFTATLASGQSYDLKFAQTLSSPGSFDVAFIDSVSAIHSAPEPGSTILAIGSGLGVILRRRRR
jgi:hypothetical protein